METGIHPGNRLVKRSRARPSWKDKLQISLKIMESQLFYVSWSLATPINIYRDMDRLSWWWYCSVAKSSPTPSTPGTAAFLSILWVLEKGHWGEREKKIETQFCIEKFVSLSRSLYLTQGDTCYVSMHPCFQKNAWQNIKCQDSP